eukprot:TRINITY_DN15110_c0_g1_i2.p1 TRINITY_DN15110_c0_g1~~TRINITY_DN15110_c0_g1_i2.p1  ORF type:complete len:431 (-),score=105.10 TRINITY_DN15110_c0_g1_i2:79-1314(-)
MSANENESGSSGSNPNKINAITCTAPVNIAVIKYWGKRDEKLILPLNSSLSGTLSQSTMRSHTSVMISTDFTEDILWLNGRQEKIDGRLQHVLSEVRKRATKNYSSADKEARVHIVSVNNFPTAAGLASSASGFCCLAYSLSQLYGVQGEISALARIGSGSACRSMYGGYVKWEMGVKDDGADSIAVQVATENHWPEIEVLILVVNDARKDTSSTAGMQQSAQTSPKMKERVTTIVPYRMEKMEKAILERDFQSFGQLTMDDSDDFHSICHETVPAIHYLNDTSKKIIHLLRELNKLSGEIKAAYTFDAGPNAVIYLPRKNIPEVLSLVLAHFPSHSQSTSTEEVYFRGNPEINQLAQKWKPTEHTSSLWNATESSGIGLKYIIHTTIGPGPQILEDPSDFFIKTKTGFPK